jgi:hypothetical protein
MMMSAEKVRQCADGILCSDLERVGQCLCTVETVLSSIGFGPDGGSPRAWTELLVCIPRLFALCLSDDGDCSRSALATTATCGTTSTGRSGTSAPSGCLHAR